MFDALGKSLAVTPEIDVNLISEWHLKRIEFMKA